MLEDAAAAAAKEAVTAASSGNPYAMLIFVLVLVTAATVFLGVVFIRERGKAQKDSDPSCGPGGGCPDIARLSDRIDGLVDQLRDDRAERRDHREEVRGQVSEIHRRVDATATKDELAQIISVSQHAQEEMIRGVMSLTDIAEAIRISSSQSPQRRPRSRLATGKPRQQEITP